MISLNQLLKDLLFVKFGFRKTLICFLLIHLKVYSQNLSDYSFNHLNFKNFGIKNVGGQLFDSKGNYWVANNEGLFKFTGYQVQKYGSVSDSKNGLLSKTIFSRNIDKNDKIWISYYDLKHLTCFDTRNNTFKHYYYDSLKDNLPKAPISAFFIDSKNNFWLSTWGDGLCLFDTVKGTVKKFFPHKGYDNTEWGDYANCITGIKEFKNGDFICSVFGYEFAPFEPLIFKPSTGEFKNLDVKDYLGVDKNNPKNFILLSSRISTFVHLDKNENLWLGTYCGLIYFDLKNKSAKRVTGVKNTQRLNLEYTKSYCVDNHQNLWISTQNSGVMLVNTSNFEVTYAQHESNRVNSIADNRIRHIAKDNDGNMWISTELGVVSIFSPYLQQFQLASWQGMNLDYFDRSIQKIPVNQVLVDKSGLMYITNENGISIYDVQKKLVTKTVNPSLYLPKQIQKDLNTSPTRVQDIRKISSNEFLIISPNTPVYFNCELNKFKTLPVDYPPKPDIALGLLFRHLPISKAPLIFYNRGRGTFFKYDSIKHKIVLLDTFNTKKEFKENYSLVLKTGNWLLSMGERMFCIYNPKTKLVKNYSSRSKSNFFPDSTIKMAFLTRDNRIWFLTNNGIYDFDEQNGKSTKLNSRIGLLENEPILAGVQQNDSMFWFAGESEILRWNSRTGSLFRFNSKFGLPELAFISSVAQTDSMGRIYFASHSGEIIFNPKEIEFPARRPKIFFNGMIVGDSTRIEKFRYRPDTSNINLKWNENFITFDFSTDQLYTPIPHQFYYRLLGLDTTWHSNGTNHRINYTNLSSGSYSLQVKFSNSYGRISQVKSILFNIHPPWWKTWWFYCLSIILIVLIVIRIIRWREKGLLAKKLELEKKITERTAEVVAKASEIELQKNIILNKNKELTDSINYAQRIQQSILPSSEEISLVFKSNFVFFLPKDIVSGDFYWFSKRQNICWWAVADCTGHGVPGGFMSMLGSELLNQIINEEEIATPDLVLNLLRDRLISALKQTGAVGENKDGMDISLCSYNSQNKILKFSGANNTGYVIRNGELHNLKANKQPIGIYSGENTPFSLTEFKLISGDVIYLTSDGYIDQFGGPRGKKFKKANFELLLKSIYGNPIEQQAQILKETFFNWKSGFEQLDDVCVWAVEIE